MPDEFQIYEDGVIAVKLFARNGDDQVLKLAIRYLKPQDSIYPDGSTSKVTNIMCGETDWFVIPHSFALAIGKTLVEQKVAGDLDGFNEEGFKRMVDWLIDADKIEAVMAY